MYNTFFYIIIAFFIAEFIVDYIIDYLNVKNIKLTLPDELKGIYDEKKYAEQQAYFKANKRVSNIKSFSSFFIVLVMLLTGVFGLLDEWLRTFIENPYWLMLTYFGILFIANEILSLPFDVYSTFVIEEKFGFNKTTHKTFVSDLIKGWLISALIGGGLLSLLLYIYNLIPQYFWILALAVVAVFSIFFMMFYSNIIVPLFNKQTPLEEGELRDKIEQFAQKAGFKLNNIYVIDGSKRSTKANAYFTGLGAKKRIVLYDTLINDLTAEEIVAVLAHEVGHYKHKHTLYSLIFSLIVSAFEFYILSLFLGNEQLACALGGSTASFHLSLIGFALIFSPISMILSILTNIFSRHNEYQADAFAASFGLAEPLKEGLKKLHVKSLSNLLPHKAYVFVHYSHPTLLQRIKALDHN